MPETPAAFGRALALETLPDGLPRGDTQAIIEARFRNPADQETALRSFDATMREAAPQ